MKVYCYSSEVDLVGTVADDANFDDAFELLCEDTGETLLVYGWLFTVEPEGTP